MEKSSSQQNTSNGPRPGSGRYTPHGCESRYWSLDSSIGPFSIDASAARLPATTTQVSQFIAWSELPAPFAADPRAPVALD